MSHGPLSPATYHVISRFVAGEWFIETDRERNMYLRLLGESLRTSDWRCIAYAVMSNHIHLGMVAGRSSRTRWLRNAHSPFGEYINRRRDRFGAVFAKGIVSCPVEPNAVASVIAYIHNNPVRAGVEPTARESTWTSHRAYLGLCSAPPWLHVDLGYELMHITAPDDFDRLVNAEAGRPRQQRRRRGRPVPPPR